MIRQGVLRQLGFSVCELNTFFTKHSGVFTYIPYVRHLHVQTASATAISNLPVGIFYIIIVPTMAAACLSLFLSRAYHSRVPVAVASIASSFFPPNICPSLQAIEPKKQDPFENNSMPHAASVPYMPHNTNLSLQYQWRQLTARTDHTCLFF